MPNNPRAAENLTPWEPGQSGNPAGKEPGRRSLSTIIRDMLEQEIDWNLIPIKDVDKMRERYKEKSAWEALVSVAYSQALAGNTKAMQWLSKSGYGDKFVHDFEPGLFSTGKMRIDVVDPKDNTPEPEPETEDSSRPPEQPAVS